MELALAKRDEAGIKVRQPLMKLEVTLPTGRQGSEKLEKLGGEYVELIKDEVNVKNVVVSSGKGNMEVILDMEITPELKQEGIKREIVRLVNGLRKDAGLTIKDTIEIYYETSGNEVKKAIEDFKDSILKDTLASKIAEGRSEKVLAEKNVKVEGVEVWLGITRR